jgi:hypothetical protein
MLLTAVVKAVATAPPKLAEGRRVGLAHDLNGRRMLSIRVQGHAEASHGCRGDGDVAGNGGGGHGGDASLGEDRVVAGNSKVDLGLFRFQLAMNTSDGLKEEDNEVASVEREYYGLKLIRIEILRVKEEKS